MFCFTILGTHSSLHLMRHWLMDGDLEEYPDGCQTPFAQNLSTLKLNWLFLMKKLFCSWYHLLVHLDTGRFLPQLLRRWNNMFKMPEVNQCHLICHSIILHTWIINCLHFKTKFPVIFNLTPFLYSFCISKRFELQKRTWRQMKDLEL